MLGDAKWMFCSSNKEDRKTSMCHMTEGNGINVLNKKATVDKHGRASTTTKPDENRQPFSEFKSR